MVKATTKPTLVPPILLELSPAAARTLKDVMSYIVGEGPAREHIDEIYFALEEAGVPYSVNEVSFSNDASPEVQGGDEDIGVDYPLARVKINGGSFANISGGDK